MTKYQQIVNPFHWLPICEWKGTWMIQDRDYSNLMQKFSTGIQFRIKFASSRKNNLAPLIFLPCLHINDNILSQGPGAFSTYYFTSLHCQWIRYQEYFLVPRMHSSIAQNKNIIKKKEKKNNKKNRKGRHINQYSSLWEEFLFLK